MRSIYNFILHFITPILFLRLLLKIRKSKNYQNYSQQGRWRERLGLIPELAFSQPPIWIHTVSVGEFIAALPLIRQLLEQHPQIPLLITSTTLTGSDQVLKTLGSQVVHVYLPWDLPSAIQRFYKRINPRLGLIMETEIWPNLIHYAAESNIPLILLNARMSPKSLRGYRKIANLSREMLGGFTAICVQSSEDAERFLKLGAQKDSLHITGSIKFDLNLNPETQTQSQQIKDALKWQNQQVIVAASTHQSEDEIVLNVFKRLRADNQELKLIIVPRHPERFQQVYQLCQATGLDVLKRSEIDALADLKAEILIGDSMGEMMLYYHLGTLVIMGGTFVPNGGHNILEPAALGLPLFYGPSMFNFKAINDIFLEQKAAIQLDNEESLYQSLSEHMKNPQQLEKLGENALKLIRKNAGAKNRMYRVISNIALLD